MSDASIKTEVRSPTPQKRSFDEANEEPVKPRVRIVEPFEEDPSDSDESEPENPPNTPFMIIGHQLNTCKPPPNVEEEPLSVRARFSIKKRPDRYWNGQIGHTFLRKNKSQSVEPSNVPIWSIQDVLGEDHLSLIKTAIISTYELDVQFAAEYFPPGKIPTIMIAPRSYKTEIEKTQIVDWVFPELPGPPRQKECFHMKFMLLFFEEFVRVVIGSPNLIFADWNIIENTLWIQDVPLRPSGFIPTDHPFASALTEVLEELGVGDALKRLNQRYPLTTLDEPSDLIEFYSWHRVKAALVHSFAGDQVGWSAVTSTGQFRLRRALKEIKARCPAGMELELECQTSEIGFRYGGAWLNIFYECAMGLNPMNRWGESRSEKGMVHPPRPPIKILYPGLRVFGKIWSHIQDEMPTKQLEKSVRGYRNAKGWLKTNYPRELFFSQRSLRGKDVFVHTKVNMRYVTHTVVSNELPSA
ncbi:hypothetical protein FRC03_003044 [Tulasnella sp. 419]|nr:hypothetical protein FRC03_003044 [Tulasnella sp. 419]